MKLKDKVAIVTGAASGIGRAIAVLFAKEGAKVVVSDINLEGAKEIVKLIEENNGNTFAILTDVSKPEDIRNLISVSIEKYNTLDILVNNAGIMDNFIPVAEITDEIWEKVCSVIQQVQWDLWEKHWKYF